MLEDLRRKAQDWIDTDAGRRTVTGVLVGVVALAVLSAVMVVSRSPSDPAADAIRDKGKMVRYYCAGCEKAGQTRVDFDEQFPIVCPHCKQRKAGMGFQCMGCKEIIAWKDLPTFRCPLCGFFYDRRVVGSSTPPPK